MTYLPSDPVKTIVFTTASTGAPVDADSLPTGTVLQNGTADATTVTVIKKATGEYLFAFTIPSGYAAGDTVTLVANATVAGVAGKANVWETKIGTETVALTSAYDAAKIAASGSALTSLGVSLSMAIANAPDNSTMATTVTAIINAIQNLSNLTANANLFGATVAEIPDSGTVQFPFTLVVRNDTNHLVDLDSTPAITAVNTVGTSRSGNLSTITHASTGVYTGSYGVASNAVAEGIRIVATGAVSSDPRRADFVMSVVDYDHGTAINTILSTVTDGTSGTAAIFNTLNTLIPHPIPFTLQDTTQVPTVNSVFIAGETPDYIIPAYIFGTDGSGDAALVGPKLALQLTNLQTDLTAAKGTGFTSSDSLHAIRARGDAAWTTGSGGGGGGGTGLPVGGDVSLTWQDDSKAAIGPMAFTIVGQGSAWSTPEGTYATTLSDGTYTVKTGPKNLVIFEDASLVVTSGAGALLITGSTTAITTSSPGLTTGHFVAYDVDNAVADGAVFEVVLVTTDGADGRSYPRDLKTVTSSGSGVVQVVNMLQNANYQARRQKTDGSWGPWVPVTTGSDATTVLPEILGKVG